MRKLIVVVAVAALAGCEGEFSSGGSFISFYTDKKTGCEYLVQSQGGVYMRMGADGRQICGSRPQYEPRPATRQHSPVDPLAPAEEPAQ